MKGDTLNTKRHIYKDTFIKTHCKEIRTHNHLVRKRTLNQLAKLAK